MVYYLRAITFINFKTFEEASKSMSDLSIFSLVLGVLGASGITALLILAAMTFYYYRGSQMGNFRWHLRKMRLKQLSALACMFFLAMTASYTVIHDAWAILYILFALKTGTWWFRYRIN